VARPPTWAKCSRQAYLSQAVSVSQLRRFDDSHDPLAQQARQRREREDLLKECGRRLRNPLKRWFLAFLLSKSQRGLTQRENAKNAGVMMVATIRRAVREVGRRLADRGSLQEADDVFFLSLDELAPALLRSPSFNVLAAVAARKAEHAQHRLLSPPPLIVGHFDPETPASAAGETRQRILQGVAVSPGLVTGKARVILQADEAERLQPGEILVAPYTDPGWTPYFLAAAAVVVEIGGLLSHGSVVAREYGIPAVVNIPAATRVIKTGQSIRVDGNRGQVILLD
jgi:phosphohistidine swiveling domain-containing protein